MTTLAGPRVRHTVVFTLRHEEDSAHPDHVAFVRDRWDADFLEVDFVAL